MPLTLLSVVIPMHNESEGVAPLHARLKATLTPLGHPFELLYVNDGSTDNTLAQLEALKTTDPCVAILDLSRRFGKEIALSAGLDHAQGDAVVVMDADLQDPPEVIPALLSRLQEGYDAVYAQRESRAEEGWLKKTSAYFFYRILTLFSTVTIPLDTGDFRILSRRAVESLKLLKEKHRYMKGLFCWIGFPQAAVSYVRAPRLKDKTKWSYSKLWGLALEGITAFTVLPLRLATYLGLASSLGAFVYAMRIVYKTWLFGEPIRGYPSLMVVILFLGGLQLLTLGIIGEYLGRTFNEVKQRPLYLVKGYSPRLIK